MQININPYANIVPKIYAYTTPEIARHNGWTKIGYTEQPSVKKRIEQQTKTADVRFNIEWQQEARYTDGSGEYFTDHNFHDYLERFEDIKREPNTEWFNVDGPTSQQLLWKFAARSYAHVQAKNKLTYILRREQQQAVDATYAYYKKCLQTGEREKAEFLWNAKPRFGKTLTSYDFMRKMDARMVLIVTNRPAIANSWFDDFEKFIAWQTDYRFVSTTDSLKERATLTREQFLNAQLEAEDKNQELRMVAFLSLQDLKGSVYFGGTIDKLRWVAENNWDLLIIDEAHEGVDTHKTDKAFDKINRKFALHLSGTPFKAVAMGKFAQEQIFNWTFSDEQEAKDNWHEETLNPYACMPRMNMYTYQMSQIAIDKVNRGIDLSDDDKTEFAFDLNEFFKTNERGQFIHKNEVKKFLDALVEQEKFPFSTPELRKELAHTFRTYISTRCREDIRFFQAQLLANHAQNGLVDNSIFQLQGQRRALAVCQIFYIPLLSYCQSMVEEFLLKRTGIIHLSLYGDIHLLPETWHTTHTGRMHLTHTLLNFMRISIDDEFGAFAQAEVRPGTFKDMGEWKEIDDAVLVCNRHTLVVCLQSCIILTIGQHHALTVARCSTGIKDINQVIHTCLLVEFLHFCLTRKILSQLQEVLEIEGCRVMCTDAHA